MNETVVVFDLETSLDRAAFSRAMHVPANDLEKIKETVGDSFPKAVFHQIAAIGVLRAQFKEGSWHIERFGAPHRGERSERDLLEGFVRSLQFAAPRLVTWNGTSFDLPVLRWRCMMHEIEAPALTTRKYFARYFDDSVDLCDVLANFDGRSKMSLDQACRALGFGGKPEDMDGSKVQELVDQGRFDLISAYCERDVLLTYLVWLRFELFCGRLSADDYRSSLENVETTLKSYQGRKPLLEDLIGCIQMAA
jgi:predicted PolB exonuclease-like 3'-5' exonuclease